MCVGHSFFFFYERKLNHLFLICHLVLKGEKLYVLRIEKSNVFMLLHKEEDFDCIYSNRSFDFFLIRIWFFHQPWSNQCHGNCQASLLDHIAKCKYVYGNIHISQLKYTISYRKWVVDAGLFPDYWLVWRRNGTLCINKTTYVKTKKT